MNLIETLHEQKRRVMAFAYVAIDKDGRLHFAKSAMTKAQYEELREFLGGKFEVTAFGQGIK